MSPCRSRKSRSTRRRPEPSSTGSVMWLAGGVPFQRRLLGYSTYAPVMAKRPPRKNQGKASGEARALDRAFQDFQRARTQGRADVIRWLQGGPVGDIRRLFLVKAKIQTSKGVATIDGRFIDLANAAEDPEGWLRRKSPDDLLLDLEILRWVLSTNPPEFRRVLLRELNQAFPERPTGSRGDGTAG